MSDWIVAIGTAAGDPLVVSLVLFAAGGVLTHLLLRRYPLGRAIARVVLLILLTIALLHAGVVPYKPLELTGTPFHDAVRGTLKIAWWLGAAWFLVGFVRAFLIVDRRPREGKLLQDLFAGLVWLAAAFASSPMSSICRSRACWRPRVRSPSSSALPSKVRSATSSPASCSTSAGPIGRATGSISKAARAAA